MGKTRSKATLWVKAQHEGALPPPCTLGYSPSDNEILLDPQGGLEQKLLTPSPFLNLFLPVLIQLNHHMPGLPRHKAANFS